MAVKLGLIAHILEQYIDLMYTTKFIADINILYHGLISVVCIFSLKSQNVDTGEHGH